ncbi:MAG: hypothetical protein ACPGTQ_03505 [Colwellia sp.]
MTKLITTSVVRGSNQGESHGGAFIVDLETREITQKLDWNNADIDWQGRGWDRGLRGIAIHKESVYIVASDELFVYDKTFKLIASYKNQYLKHCHEITVFKGSLFITSTGFDSLLAFHLEQKVFHWALHIETDGFNFSATAFNPQDDKGPMQLNKLHLNNVFCNQDGLFVSGLHSGGLLHFNGSKVSMSVSLPAGTHNAQPYKNGVLFNDTKSDVVRYVSRDETEDRAFNVPQFSVDTLTAVNLDESGIARASFGRGLCIVGDGVIATGSSPSTIAIHDLNQNVTGVVINMTSDVRHAIHGLEIWPF